jgi:hypothetical protein
MRIDRFILGEGKHRRLWLKNIPVLFPQLEIFPQCLCHPGSKRDEAALGELRIANDQESTIHLHILSAKT